MKEAQARLLKHIQEESNIRKHALDKESSMTLKYKTEIEQIQQDIN